jgi:hypothetical protein
MTWRRHLPRRPRTKGATLRSLEHLEGRLLFDGSAWTALPTGDEPPLARDEAFQTPAGHDLIVDAAVGGAVLGLQAAGQVAAPAQGQELAFSPEFGLLAVREATRVVLLDAASGAVVSEHPAIAEFADFDLTPDGRYLFVADDAGPERDWDWSAPPHWVHRFDLAERVWTVVQAPWSAHEVKAICAELVAVRSNGFSINSYQPAEAMVELSSRFQGAELGYDHARNLLVHASFAPDMFSLALGRPDTQGYVFFERFTGVPFSWEDPRSLVIDEQYYFLGRGQVEALDPTNLLRVYPSPVMAAGGGLAFTDNAYFAAATGAQLGTLPFATTAVAVSSDGREVWALDGAGHAQRFLIERQGRGLLANDQGSPLQAVIDVAPLHGQLDLAADGTFVYRPEAGYVGQDSFRYRAVGAEGAFSLATVSIEVLGATGNRAPVAGNLSLVVAAGGTLELSAEQGRLGAGLAPVGQFSARGNVEQMLHSAQFDRLITRGSRVLRIWDATTGGLLETREAQGRFSDMDFSPDGRYLFVSDYSGEGSPPSSLWRLDLQSGEWEQKNSPTPLWRIESLGADRIVGASANGWEATLFHWSGFNSKLIARSTIRIAYPGDMHFDAATKRLLYAQNERGNYLYELLLSGDTLTQQSDARRIFSDDLVLSPDGTRLYTGDLQREMQRLGNHLQGFLEPIVAATNELAFGASAVYSAQFGFSLGDLPFESQVQVAAADGGRWWAFDATSDTIHVYRIGPPTAGVLSQSRDADGDPLELQIVDQPMHGTLEWSADGKATYRPAPGFVGQDTFTYRAFDGRLTSALATATVRVASTAPPLSTIMAVPDQFTLRSGKTLEADDSAEASLSLIGQLELSWSVAVVEYSPAYDVVVLDEGRGIRLVRGSTGEAIPSPAGLGRLTALSPDGRYLFFATSGGSDGNSDSYPAKFPIIHRYDLALEHWESRRGGRVIQSIEAVSGDQLVVLAQVNQTLVVWMDFGPSSQWAMSELALVDAGRATTIDVDPRGNEAYYATSQGYYRVGRVQYDVPWPKTIQEYQAADRPQGAGSALTLSTDARSLFLGMVQLDPDDLARQIRTYPESILEANARLAFGSSQYYDLETGQVAGSWQYPGAGLALSNDGRHVWVSEGTNWLHYAAPTAGKGLLANDRFADGANLQVELVTAPQHGRLELAADGTFRYTPNAGFVGEDRFEYRFQTEQGYSAVTPATLVVRPPNTPPTLAEIPAQQVNKGEAVPLIPLAISDSSSAAEEIAVTATVDNASLVTGLFVEGEGFSRHLRVETAAGKAGTSRITVRVADGEFAVERTFDLTVHAVNEVPRARPDLYSLSQNVPLEISARQGVLSNDSDGDGDALQVTLLRNPLHGTLTLAADGGFRYVPHQGYVDDDSFRYRASDGQGTAEAEVALSIVDNSAPRIVSTNLGGTQLPGPLQFRAAFNEPLQASLLDPADLVLIGAQGRVPVRSLSFDAASYTVIADFGELAIGEYTLQLPSTATTFVDLAGLRLDGEPARSASGMSGNGVAGGDYTLKFIVSAATFDIDGDGAARPETDGELVRRYLAGLRGAELIAGAVAPTAARATAPQIEAYFARTGAMLDADGNGRVELGFDDVLLRRFLAGVEGDELITGALAAGATRTTAGAVWDWLDENMPTLPGDANRDGRVDLNDFAALKASFGRANAGRRSGDLDRNGTVDLADFGLLKANFGRQIDGV